MTGHAGQVPLRVGVVGLEHYHVTGWLETLELFPDQLEIVALYDPNPAAGARLAPRFVDPSLRPGIGERYRGLSVETDLAALIDRHVLDLALVTLPNRDAPAAIAQLALSGVHLLVDKPAALDAAAAREAFAIARKAGVRVVTGLTRRYAPAWRAARAAVAEGVLGTLITGAAFFAASTVAVRGPDNPIFAAEAGNPRPRCGAVDRRRAGRRGDGDDWPGGSPGASGGGCRVRGAAIRRWRDLHASACVLPTCAGLSQLARAPRYGRLTRDCWGGSPRYRCARPIL